MSPDSENTKRRFGDEIQIDGDYQYKASMSPNAVQRFWHQSKLMLVDRLLPSSPTDFILDVGCGSGVVSAHLAQTGAEVWGLDANESALEFAREKFSGGRLRFLNQYVDDTLEVPRPVDKIYCLEVIEHLYQEQGSKLLKVFHNLLVPGGKVFLTTPNYRSIWPLVEWLLDRYSTAEPMHSLQHVSKYNPTSLSNLAHQESFIVEHCETVLGIAPWFAPLNWGLARSIHQIEPTLPNCTGCIVVYVLKKAG